MTYTHFHWLYSFMKDLPSPYKDEDKFEIYRILCEIYTVLEKLEIEGVSTSVSKSSSYKQEVFDYLDQQKKIKLCKDDLIAIQKYVENKTECFDEKSIYNSVGSIVHMLIREDLPNARDYLKSRLDNVDDVKLISVFGVYTIEALIVHVLSQLYNSSGQSPLIRPASLVDRLESSVRSHASSYNKYPSGDQNQLYNPDENVSTEKDKKKGGKRRSKIETNYPIGTELLQLMIDRGMIELRNDVQGPCVKIEKKKGAYYVPKHLFAVCNFDLSLLPVKLSLPMVCPPLKWKASKDDQIPRYLSDITGGYLSTPTSELYINRYTLLTSSDINNYYIYLGKDYKSLCDVMNKLQSQPFKINSSFLKYVQENETALVKEGLLLPSFLSRMNLITVAKYIREIYMKDEKIQKIMNYSVLLEIFSKLIQRSSYERLILKLATAYEGYHFYLPAFLDFRGRIYRSGVLHFHERDLARSLIVFADQPCDTDKENTLILLEAASFHYKSFSTPNEGCHYICDSLEEKIVNEASDLIKQSIDAKKPFQYLSSIYARLFTIDYTCCIPITQDASASAYQLMSYFLLDDTLADKTNLFPSSDGKIQDIYTFFLEDLKNFLFHELKDENLSQIVCNNLTRKIVKGIFMPLIYGKTLMSTADDLKAQLSKFIIHKECFVIAKAIYKYWSSQCHKMDSLIKLIRNIGWIASARDCPVLYKVRYFTTVQDYHKMETAGIFVYDRVFRKKRKVSLKVPSKNRDSRKTEISTFVNFIHQRDAYIAMRVVEKIQDLGSRIPIYTVHDNFITTVKYSKFLAYIYGEVFREMGPPLSIINEFIYMNVIKPIEDREGYKPIKGELDNHNYVFKNSNLSKYLNANIPDGISQREKKTWNARISGILNSYDTYIRTVCGDFKEPNPRACWDSHERKWNDFQSKLKSKVGSPWYCVHY